MLSKILAGILGRAVMLQISVQLCSAVTFNTVSQSADQSYGNEEDTHRWAVGTPSVVTTITISGLTTTGSATVKVVLSDGSQLLSCQFLVGDDRCTKACAASITAECGATSANTASLSYTLTNLLAEHDEASLQFVQDTTSIPDWNFGTKTIQVKECSRFLGTVVVSNTGCTDYQYNCRSTFRCGNTQVGDDFARTCRGDATWDNSTSGCVPVLYFDEISKSDDVAVGCTSTISTSITAGTPISAHYGIHWKANAVTVASYSLTPTGADDILIAESDLKDRVSVNQTAVADMRLHIENLLLSDNGTVVNVSAMFGTKDAGSSNTGTTLLVSECPEFPDASPIERTCNPYHGNCKSTFRCHVAGNTFTATCLCSATFDNKPNCSSSTPSIPVTSAASTSIPATAASVESATSSLNSLYATVTYFSEGRSGFAACCPTLDSGKMAAVILGGTYLIILFVTAILSGKLEPKYSGPPTKADTETSGNTRSIIFQYAEDKVEKHTLKVNVGKISNGSTAAITGVKHNCVGKLSWTSNGDNNQAYLVLVVRESVVMEETVVIGSSYMHWMASSCEYTYVIVAIGNGQLGKPHLYTTDKSAYYKNFWAWLLFLLSLILIAVGVWLMVNFPNSNCCAEACDPCALSANGHVGWVLAVLAISILWGLLAWIFVETRCPSCFKCWSPVCGVCAGLCCCCYYCRKSKPAKGGSGNSVPKNNGAGRISPAEDKAVASA